MDRFLIQRLLQKNEIFNVFFEFDKEISKALLIKCFILLNKYYPSWLMTCDERIKIDGIKIDEEINWEDYVINGNLIDNLDSYGININVPLFCKNNDGGVNCEIKYLKAIVLYYGLEETTNRNFIGIDFYGNVYTNIRHDFDPENRVYVPVDQSTCAKKNREIMTAFLKELDILLEGEITEFLSPFYLDEKYIFKYGIKSDAVLK